MIQKTTVPSNHLQNGIDIFLDSDIIESIIFEDAVFYANLHEPKDLPITLEKFYLETFITAWVYSYNHAYEMLNEYSEE